MELIILRFLLLIEFHVYNTTDIFCGMNRSMVPVDLGEKTFRIGDHVRDMNIL